MGELLCELCVEGWPRLEECKYYLHMTFYQAMYDTVTFYRSPIKNSSHVNRGTPSLPHPPAVVAADMSLIVPCTQEGKDMAWNPLRYTDEEGIHGNGEKDCELII